MKKIGFMIVYNDADYVKYAVDSVLDFVDEMVVVEGAFQITMDTGKPPRSNDGTLDILKQLEKDGKITLIHANLKEHKDHYDIGYQQAIKRGADWAVMVDSDEVWTSPSKLMANAVMKNQLLSEILEIRIKEYCFINDFQHWYEGVYPRIFRAINDSKFVYDNEVQFSGYERGRHSTLLMASNPIYHYGYVRRKKRWEMKQEYMWEKDQNPSIKRDYRLEGNSYCIPADLPIYKFSGNHPNIMKSHPFYDKTAEEIIYG